MANIITSSSAAEDIASLLASLGHGTVAEDIFINKEPDGPGVSDCVITLYDTDPWSPPELSYDWEYPGLQVRVRWSSYQEGKAKARELMQALHGYVGTVGSIKYHLIRVANGPVALGEDSKGRPRFTFNLELQRSL